MQLTGTISSILRRSGWKSLYAFNATSIFLGKDDFFWCQDAPVTFDFEFAMELNALKRINNCVQGTDITDWIHRFSRESFPVL